MISPTRGGAIEILTVFGDAVNYADVLSRRLEAYHRDPDDPAPSSAEGATATDGDDPVGSEEAAQASGIASVHDRHSGAPPPPTPDEAPLALMQEVAVDQAGPDGTVLADWRLHPFRLADDPAIGGGRVRLRCVSETGAPRLEKMLDIHDDGRIDATLDWSEAGLPAEAAIVCRLPLAHPGRVQAAPAAAESRERIVTLARSERGFERIDQGEIAQLAWPASAGGARVRLRPGGGPGTVGGPA